MNTINGVDRRGDDRLNISMLLVTAFALSVGLAARFWRLGDAPLAVDEYYFGMSILNVLERGFPEFACGGFYTRGVLIQYLTVPLLQAGLSLEHAVRFWPAVASCLTILGVWRIGKLMGGAPLASLAVVLVSLSIWEIEFARFGRMYAPFQAAFVWYVFFQIQNLVENRESSKWWAMLVSALSIFIYAGASFLLVLNFLPLVWSGRRSGAAHLAASALLLLGGIWYYSIDFRYHGVPVDSLPPSDADAGGLSLPISLPVIPEIWLPLLLVGVTAVLFLLWWFRRYVFPAHPSAIYWTLAIAALGLGSFAFAVGLILAGMLLALPTARPITEERRRLTVPVLLCLATGWTAVLLGSHLAAGLQIEEALRATVEYLFDYPDVYYRVVRPWLVTIPGTTIALTILVVPVLWRSLCTSLKERDTPPSGVRYLLGILVLLVMLSAAFRQPYTITRYTYFLYPVVLLLAATGIFTLAGLVRSYRIARVMPFAVLVALFLATEDYSTAHLTGLNEAAYRYRTAYDSRLAAHYYARWDFRTPAEYVNEKLRPDDRVIIFDEPFTYYLKHTDGVFVRSGTEIHGLVWACNGERHLWSDEPLLDSEDEVRRAIQQASGAVWLIMRTNKVKWLEPLEQELVRDYSLAPRFLSEDGHIAVYVIEDG